MQVNQNNHLKYLKEFEFVAVFPCDFICWLVAAVLEPVFTSYVYDCVYEYACVSGL